MLKKIKNKIHWVMMSGTKIINGNNQKNNKNNNKETPLPEEIMPRRKITTFINL